MSNLGFFYYHQLQNSRPILSATITSYEEVSEVFDDLKGSHFKGLKVEVSRDCYLRFIQEQKKSYPFASVEFMKEVGDSIHLKFMFEE